MPAKFVVNLPSSSVNSGNTWTVATIPDSVQETQDPGGQKNVRSHGRMEDFTEAKSLDTGPTYFFDQMKPKRKKWGKREREGHFPNLRYTSGAICSYTNSTVSKKLKEARLSTVAEYEKKDEFHSFGISQIHGVSKFPPNLRITEIYLQKNLFEEYKLITSEILHELGEILQKYAEYNITFPAGVVNLMNYSWHDLIDGAFKCTTKNLKKNSALKRDSNDMTQISTYSREKYHKENHLVKAKKDPPSVSSALVKQQYSQISQDSHLPVVIRFSLLSKICLENGWISQNPHSKLELLKWKTILNTAVKRLQEAIIQIKAEEAKLQKEGFNKRLILCHYNDPKDMVKVGSSPKVSRCFWLELLKSNPMMPTVKEADPKMKKFHYALVDGSSLTYYPSGRLAVCQSYSALPWGGMYTNIFSDLPNQVILGTFTPFGCGSISFPNSQIISMMFNQDGGMVISKKGNIIREWMWPSKGKLDDPVEIWVNKFITVEISGRFAITLDYKWHPQSLKLSLAPVKCKFFHQFVPEEELNTLSQSFSDVNSIPKEAMELFKAYKEKCKPMKSTTRDKDASSLMDTMKIATFDPIMDISPMSDITTVTKLRRLQKKVKHILLCWLDYYRFALGIESLHICEIPKSPQKVIRIQKVSPAKFPLKQSAKEKDEYKEYLRYRNTFLKLKGVFQPSPLYRTRKTPVSNQCLRRTLCGKEGGTCQCGIYSIPEVTDLEYDHLISTQLSSVDQVIIVHVTSAKETDKSIKEMAKVYRKLNRSKSMPCIQSCSDPFRLLKYNITSASKFTGNSCPLLVQRHNVIPGIFLMYIRGKLVFANFIFNGYSTSAKDLQKQIVKTTSDYHTGYFLPDDFRIR